MIVEGVVENGLVKLDGGRVFADGTRVRVVEEPQYAPDEGELAILREGVADSKAGRFRPLREVVADVAAQLGLPPITFDGERRRDE